MATRTFYLKGKAFSQEGNVSLEVYFNGSLVFDGEVSTTDAEYTPVFENETLCSWSFDSTLNATVLVSITVSGGTLGASINAADYITLLSTEDLAEDYSEEKLVDFYKSCIFELDKPDAGPDTRSNIQIDGEACTDTSPDLRGWVYTVTDGSTITFDQEIDSSLIPVEFR